MSTFYKIWLIIGVLFVGAAVSLICYQVILSRESTVSSLQERALLDQYRRQISTETNAYKLTVSGLRQFDHNLPEMSLITLKRATESDKNYRDAWIALGIAELEVRSATEALDSLKVAQTIDPIHAETYKYMGIAYERLADQEGIKLCQDKQKMLNQGSTQMGSD